MTISPEAFDELGESLRRLSSEPKVELLIERLMQMADLSVSHGRHMLDLHMSDLLSLLGLALAEARFAHRVELHRAQVDEWAELVAVLVPEDFSDGASS